MARSLAHATELYPSFPSWKLERSTPKGEEFSIAHNELTEVKLKFERSGVRSGSRIWTQPRVPVDTCLIRSYHPTKLLLSPMPMDSVERSRDCLTQRLSRSLVDQSSLRGREYEIS